MSGQMLTIKSAEQGTFPVVILEMLEFVSFSLCLDVSLEVEPLGALCFALFVVANEPASSFGWL